MKRTILSVAITTAITAVCAQASEPTYPEQIADAVAEVQAKVKCLKPNNIPECLPTRITMWTHGSGTRICWQKRENGVWGTPWDACEDVPNFRCELDGYQWWSNEMEGRECIAQIPAEDEPLANAEESKRVCVSRQHPQSDDVEFIDGEHYIVIRKSMDGESVEVSEIEETDFEERCHVFPKKETAEEEQYWSVAKYEVVFGPETTSHDWIVNVWIRGETHYPFTQGQATQFQDLVFPSGQENKRIPMQSVDPFETDQKDGETYYRFDIPAWGGGDTKVIIGTGMVWGTDL